MSVATPKSQAKEPIQFDIVIVCRKRDSATREPHLTTGQALASAREKLIRLQASGFTLSRNDCLIVQFGQLLPLLRCATDFELLAAEVEPDLVLIAKADIATPPTMSQKRLFEDA